MKSISEEDINKKLESVIKEIEIESKDDNFLKSNYDWNKKIHVKRSKINHDD